MDVLLKAIAGVLISVILYHTIPAERKELSLLLCITACCLVCISALSYLQPVIDFLEHLQTVGTLDTQMLEILLRTVGIGLLSEITTLICKDFGNGTLGKSIQFLATAVTLWLALPVFYELLELIESVLSAV